MEDLLDQITAAIDAGDVEAIFALAKQGAYESHDFMLENEERLGNEEIKLGSRPWYGEDRWFDTSLVTEDALRVFMVAIWVKKPLDGSFRMMVDGIIAEGKTPVLVEIIDPGFVEYVENKGWRYQKEDVGMDTRRMWVHPVGFDQ